MFQSIPSALGIGPFQTIHASGKLFYGVIAAAVVDQLQMKLRVSFPMCPHIFIRFPAECIDGSQSVKLGVRKMLYVQLKHAAFQNISKLNHFVDILHGQTNDFIAIAGDISQNIVSAECQQGFTDRRLTALILFYQIFFI